MNNDFSTIRGLQAIIFWIILMCIVVQTKAQAPAWQSLTTGILSASSDSYVRATATDSQGNVFIGGQFEGSLTLGGTTLVSAGSLDGFVAKWSPAAGTFVWAQRLGGPGNDAVNGLAAGSGAVYAAGYFPGTASFGATTLRSTGFNTMNDAFVAKVLDAGNSSSFSWVRQFGGEYHDGATAIAVNGTNVYVAGFYVGPLANFGPFTLTGSYFTGRNVYVAKLTDAGLTANVSWVQEGGGDMEDTPNVLAVSGSAVYVAGTIGVYSTTSLPARFGNTVLTSGRNGGAFVARLTDAGTSGAFEWAVAPGGAGTPNILGLAVRGPNVYVGGEYYNASLALGPFTLPNAGAYDGFVAKLTDAGNGAAFTWALPLGGTGSDGVGSLALSGNSLYAVGYFHSAPGSFGGTVLSNSGLADVFVAKLLDTGLMGSITWAQRAGGPGQEESKGVVLIGSQVVVAGNAQVGASFGNFTITGTNSGRFPYVATLTDPTLTSTTAALSPASIALFPNPAHGRATVHLPAGTGPATLTVLDALGRPVRTLLAATHSQTELSLAGLAPGLYAVRVQAGAATATRRLVVE